MNSPKQTTAGQSSDHADAYDDPRVAAAMQSYLASLERGQRPIRERFLADHAEIAALLGDCLDAMEFVHSAGEELREPAPTQPLPDGESILAAPLGDYRISREIGRGGMGIVYEAVQLSLGRRVALKVLPFAAALDEKHLQRFKNEAHAAAHLHHTNIVPVYAVGCERGVHFYAMQLIEGKTVSALIRERRELAGLPTESPRGRSASRAAGSRSGSRSRERLSGEGPAAHAPDEPATDSWAPDQAPPVSASRRETQPVNALSTERTLGRNAAVFRAIAQLGVQAAEGLEHAHQFGVVHRDIKPANLLIDNRGNLWITDFGLAQFQTDVGLTRTGDVVGTLRYMSPEQSLGQRVVLDHRTDIYSLGVTLYELLTLEPAFSDSNRNVLLRRIAEEDPRPPRAIDRNIPSELETIVLKCISKAPGERYASAQDLADDLQRFLQDRPIAARRPNFWQRTVKWSRRHRTLVGSAVVGLMFAAAGLLVSTVMIAQEQRKTTQALKREKERALEAERQRSRAEDALQQASEVVDTMTEIGEVDLAENTFMFNVRRRLLAGSLSVYQQILRLSEDNPTFQAELTKTRDRVESILLELADVSRLNEVSMQSWLLSSEDVQADIGLTAEQQAKLEALGPQIQERLQRHRDMSDDERRRDVPLLADEVQRAREQLLSADQAKRLVQISLQISLQIGHSQIFSEPKVIEALELTQNQQLEFRKMPRRPGWSGWPRREGRGDKETLDPKQLERQKQNFEKIQLMQRQWDEKFEDTKIRVLTPAQLAKWREMIGPPYKGGLPRF